MYSPPSDATPTDFSPLGGYTVFPGAVNTTAYDNNKHLQVAWVGARYALLPNLDINGAYYIAHQNDYAPSTAKPGACGRQYSAAAPGATPQGTLNNYCEGNLQAISALARLEALQAPRCLCGRHVFGRFRRHRKRIHPQHEFAPTAGLRFAF